MNISQAVKRIQQLADLVEKLIQQSNELRERVIGVEETVDDTNGRLEVLERAVERQSALLEALAEQEGIDVEAVAADVEDRAAGGADRDARGSDDGDADDAAS